MERKIFIFLMLYFFYSTPAIAGGSEEMCNISSHGCQELTILAADHNADSQNGIPAILRINERGVFFISPESGDVLKHISTKKISFFWRSQIARKLNRKPILVGENDSFTFTDQADADELEFLEFRFYGE